MALKQSLLSNLIMVGRLMFGFRMSKFFSCIVFFALLVLVSCKDDEPVITPQKGELVLRQLSIKVGEKEYCPVDTIGSDFYFCVPQDADISKLKLVVAHDNDTFVHVDGSMLAEDDTICDFSDLEHGVTCRVSYDDGEFKDYTIRVLNTNLPTVFVTTPELQAIVDKENWIASSSIKIWTPEDGLSYTDTTNIRGRGNYTWTYPKKPYAIKLNKKAGLLGLTKHKRFCLLACWKGFIGNYYMAEVAKRCTGQPWVPQGKFVELILNGEFKGLYYLSEQIKIDKNRVNITEIKKDDLGGANLTGGYLLEFDEEFDEEFKFKSDIYQMPVMLKSPDESVPDEQLAYIKDYVNSMEKELSKIGTEESHYQDYLDVNSFADYWMASEVIYNHEVYKPRSFYMYKGRDGVDSEPGTVCKMKAGPFWDQEMIFVDHWWNNKDAHYFGALFKDAGYRAAVKNNWKQFRANLEGRGKYPHVLDNINSTYNQISFSYKRDSTLWKNEGFSLHKDVKTLNDGFISKLDWMEEFIMGLE